MRNLVLLFSALILGTSGIMASSTKENKVAERNAYRYNNSFIFVENGITFSVYPDGEFDFYIENQISGRRNGVTFNSGYDYSPYAQYDDYGAVIQVENVPIYYDYHGRVTQIGDVDINYRNGRVRRVGGMYVYYNHRGYYDYHTGYINVYNRYYTYRPFHRFFVRPSLGFCLVFNRPYRRYYSPIRYTYYNPYRYNHRRVYAKIGREHKYNRVRRDRASIYRNDRRVAVRDNGRRSERLRSNRTVSRTNGKQFRNNDQASRRNVSTPNNGRVRNNSSVRSSRSDKIAGRTAVNRTKRIESRTVRRGDARPSNNRTVTKRSTTVRSPQRNTVSKRSVTRTPDRKTVRRSTTTYKTPKRSTARQSSKPTTSRSRSASTRSASPRRTVKKAPARSSRNNRSANTRSSRSGRNQK